MNPNAKPAVAVAIDGEVVSPEAASISVFDRGFLYGDGVFETLRTYRQKLFRVEEHVARLVRSAATVRLTLPLSASEIAAELESMADRALEIFGEGASKAGLDVVVRFQITRGTGTFGLLPRATGKARRIAYLLPYAQPSPEVYREGIGVITFPTYRPSDAARGAKVANYLESIIALETARDAGADEALIVNSAGFVVEGTTSNLFVVRGGTVVTPPASSGALEGITRMTVIEAAERAGIPIEQRDLTVDEVRSADEAFITSTLRDVMSISSIDQKDLPLDRPMAAKIAEAFAAHVAKIATLRG